MEDAVKDRDRAAGPDTADSPGTGEVDPGALCFGLDLDTDRASLAGFMRLFASPALLETLAARMEQGEIEDLVSLCTALMGRHLSEDEYHRLFLGEEGGHGHHP